MFLQLLPEQAAMCSNHVAKTGVPATMSTNGDVEFPWPGFESEPLNKERCQKYHYIKVLRVVFFLLF